MEDESHRVPKQWYKNKKAIILLLIFFFPVGLFLMWKYSTWSKKTRWVVTGSVILLLIFGYISSYNSTPTITVSNIKDSRASTDDAEYTLVGEIYSLKDTSLTINEQTIPLSESSKFNHKVTLAEGDNVFNLTATNENGTETEIITIHRTTQAEFAARAEAERLAAEKNKAESDAKTALEKAEAEAKLATDSKTQPETQPQQDANSNSGNTNSFYINNAYFKGDNKYDVVVYSSNKDTLRIYVNDGDYVTAEVNKEGWATFQKVKITGRSKLSFAKKVGWIDYYPVNYVNYISVAGENVTFIDAETAASLDKAEAERKAQEEAKTIDTNEQIYLRQVSKDAILTLLKAPSTAEFAGDGFIESPLQGWQGGWATDYADVYYMQSYVDSENSFGAMLRSEFRVGFRISNGNYNIVFVFFDGKEILDNR